MWYYPSGKPHRIVNYKNGLKCVAQALSVNVQCALMEELMMCDGGRVVLSCACDRDGHYETYYPNGLKCEEGQYQDDQEVGQWRKWSRMGHFLGCSEPSTIDHPLPSN